MSKSADFVCRVFVFISPNILKAPLISWSTVLSLNNIFQCVYKLLGQLLNIALCIFTLQFSGISRQFVAFPRFPPGMVMRALYRRFSPRFTIRDGTTGPSSFGDQCFYNIRKNNKFYADRTKFALDLFSRERAVLLRPPRTGKSLFINTVECLYDVRFKGEFEELFDGLYVGGENKPAAANSLYVMTIALPSTGDPDYIRYEEKFHNRVLSNISSFLFHHPEILEQLQMNRSEFKREFKGDTESALELIADVVGRQKLMVLVDEYDRAPMDFYASICARGISGPELKEALEPVAKPLKDFLHKLKTLKLRYYVTGIFTVPGMKMSIFNNNKDLTHAKEFAHAFGFLEDDVRNALRFVAGVENEKEMERAVSFLRVEANGYKYFGAEEPLFNPQLISEFLDNYVKQDYANKLPIRVYDQNQVMSSNNLQITTHSAELTRKLIQACTAGQPFDGTIETQTDEPSPITYLYQLGVLSLHDLDITYCKNKDVRLVVPNVSVRHDYITEFLKNHMQCKGTMRVFVANPTIDTLYECLKRMRQQLKPGWWTNTRTESDISCLLAADLFLNSTADAGTEHPPGDDTKQKIDVKAATDENVIILEVKYVRARTEGRAPSQSLTSAEVTKLDLVTTEVGEAHPEKGLQNMLDLDDNVLLKLKTKYSGTISGEKHHAGNVKDVLGLAEKQVSSPDHSRTHRHVHNTRAHSNTPPTTRAHSTTHTTTYALLNHLRTLIPLTHSHTRPTTHTPHTFPTTYPHPHVPNQSHPTTTVDRIQRKRT